MSASAAIIAGLAGVTAVAAPLSYATFLPGTRWWGEVISHGPRESRKVALTFDDGPTEPFTGQVLDVLREEKARATFFVIGANAARHPDLIRRMHEEGHQIGNHTFDHPHYGWLRGTGYWEDQIARADDLLEKLTGKRATVFRPPMGFKTICTVRAATRLNHSLVAWSRRSFDGIHASTRWVLARSSKARSGEIVLLHDGIAPNHRSHNPSPTVAAVGPLIRALRERGLEPVTVGELLAG